MKPETVGRVIKTILILQLVAFLGTFIAGVLLDFPRWGGLAIVIQGGLLGVEVVTMALFEVWRGE